MYKYFLHDYIFSCFKGAHIFCKIFEFSLLPHRIRLSQPILKADKKDLTSTIFNPPAAGAWHTTDTFILSYLTSKRNSYSSKFRSWRIFLSGSGTFINWWFILDMTSVLITVILPKPVMFLLGQVHNRFPLLLLLLLFSTSFSLFS